ncbi:MAG: hypothetical protein WA864_28150 [Acetobacteraceae bacterium]
MRWRKDTDKPTDRASSDIVRTAVLASLIAALLASSVAVVSAARAIDIGPKVGDILVFHQGARMPADWEFTATTTSSTGATCTLVPLTMALEGGSLVVEQRFTTPRAFQVHWAGGRTSSQASDCGRNAELILPGEDLQLLTNAVGGAGVEHRIFPEF